MIASLGDAARGTLSGLRMDRFYDFVCVAGQEAEHLMLAGSQQLGDLKVMREILQRIEGGQLRRD